MAGVLMRTDRQLVAHGKLFSREGIEWIILCLWRNIWNVLYRSVNGRASYLGSRSHCMCKKCILQNCCFVLFFWSKMVWVICNSVWMSDWGAELRLCQWGFLWPAFPWCLFGRALLPSGNTSVSPLTSIGGVWHLQSQRRSLQLGGSNVDLRLLPVWSLVFWYFTSHRELI